MHLFRLVLVGVGTGAGALKFAEKQGLPLDIVFGDADRKVRGRVPSATFTLCALATDPLVSCWQAYAALGLDFGVDRTFFNPATPMSLLKRGLEGLKEGTKNYTVGTTVFFAGIPAGKHTLSSCFPCSRSRRRPRTRSSSRAGLLCSTAPSATSPGRTSVPATMPRWTSCWTAASGPSTRFRVCRSPLTSIIAPTATLFVSPLRNPVPSLNGKRCWIDLPLQWSTRKH